eukprot:4740125-Pleurochrysis_carterae.AAC.1
MDPTKNITMLLYDTETGKKVEISPVYPALQYTYADTIMFTRHPDVILRSLMFSFYANYDDPYNMRRYKLIELHHLNCISNTIRATQDDFFPMNDDDDDDERQAMQDELEGANAWGGEPDY